MIDQPFRAWFAGSSRPLVNILVRRNVHPDVLTWIGFTVSVSSSWFTVNDRPIMALCLWWLGRVFDGLDGLVARAANKQGPRGGFLDINLDMAAYAMVAVAFMLKTQWYLIWAFILVGYILCVSSALSLGEIEEVQDNRSLRIANGLAEAGETGIFYTLLWLLPSYGELFCFLWLGVLSITVFSRFVRVYKKGSRS